jgi:hypothetical protein
MGGSILGNCQGNKNFTSSVGCCLQQLNSMASFVSSCCTNKSWSYASLFKCTVLNALTFGLQTVQQLCSGPHHCNLQTHATSISTNCKWTSCSRILHYSSRNVDRSRRRENDSTMFPGIRQHTWNNYIRYPSLVLPSSQCLLENSTLL